AEVFEDILQLAAQRIEHGGKVRFKIESSNIKLEGRAWIWFKSRLPRDWLTSGRIPKWPTGADCKSAGLRLRWFESSSYHHPQNQHFAPLLVNVFNGFMIPDSSTN